MTLTLRERTGEDRRTVVGWVPDAAALYLFTGPRLRWPLDDAQLQDLEGAPGYSAWTGIDDSGSPIGHFDLTVEDRTAHLGRVIIDPGRRGEGRGRELVDLAIEKARELDAVAMTLNVILANASARHIYETAGFRPLPTAGRADYRAMTLAL